jgi:hypothetical protein
MEPGSDWVSFHIFYDEGHDALLTECVGPLVGEAVSSGKIDSFFYLRHWDGGPHLRLRLKPRAPRAAESVIESVSAWIAKNPSPELVDTAAYRELAAYWARMEGSSHEPTRRDVNSIHPMPYHPEHGKYGHGESLMRCEEHFHVSSRSALDVLARADRRGELYAAGYCAVHLSEALAPVGGHIGAPLGDAGGYVGPSEVERYLRLHHKVDQWIAASQDPRPGGHPVRSYIADVRARAEALPPELRPVALYNFAHLYCNRLGLLPDEEGHLRKVHARVMSRTEA